MSELSTESSRGTNPPSTRRPGTPSLLTSDTSLALAEYVKQAKALPSTVARGCDEARTHEIEAPRASPSRVEGSAQGEGAQRGAAISDGDEKLLGPSAELDASFLASSNAHQGRAAGAIAWRVRAFRCLGICVLINVATYTLAALTSSPRALLLGAFLGALFGLAGCGYGLASFFRGFEVYPELPARQVVWSLVGSIMGLAAAVVGFGVALFSTLAFTRGRQVRRFGRALLPPVGAGDAWSRAVPGVPAGMIALGGEGEETRRALAAQWRENGRTEHASVAAFARHTLDLMALGAPPALVAAAQRDALDEIRHAELCFALARAIDGRNESPGAFPGAARSLALPRPRLLALGELAVDSLVDGALHEGASARIVAKLARRCEEPAVASILKSIAADEGRHSAHAWDVVRWCVAEGGEPVLRALAAAARALPRTVRSGLPAAARGGSWERWGIAGEALEADELARARADAVRRVEALASGLLRRAA